MTPTNAPEVFAPLVTQANALPSGHEWFEESSAREEGCELPRGLGVLAQAGSRLRRSLLVALLLGTLSLVELGVLLLFPESRPLVVWEERSVTPLVEVP